MNKKTIVLLSVLVVIGGAAAYFLFFKDSGIMTAPEPEKVAKRMKIEVPSPPEVKKEITIPAGLQTQTQPSAEQGAAKPVEVKPEIKKKEEIKTAAKEIVPEKKEVVKKDKQKPVAGNKTAYKLWAVHVASYVSKEEALSVVKRLKQDNYNAYMTEFAMKGKYWYRVRIGFYASDREAKAVVQKISDSHSISGAWTVKPKKKEITSHLN